MHTIFLTSDQNVAPAYVFFSTFSIIRVMCVDKSMYYIALLSEFLKVYFVFAGLWKTSRVLL